MSVPQFLLTNDDGIHAPGLLALAQTLAALGRVSVVAPERNWSAAGHSKTMHKPLRAWPVALPRIAEAMATSGSPSDCVALALLGLVERGAPDLVISGINLGPNVGHDVTYSGTVAAAMEAVIGGVSAIAVSLDSQEPYDCEPAASFVAHLARRVMRAELDVPILLNVNIPALPREAVRGVQVTCLGRRIYRDALIHRQDPRGRSYYWIGGDPPGGVADEGTDIGALAQGCISVTPVRLDLTDHDRLGLVQDWRLEVS